MTAPADQSRVHARAQLGMGAPVITVETHLPGGLPGFTLVGMPETAVREARDRVKSAIGNCGLDFPQGRVLVNLAPADLTKQGARLDLAIAVSVLSATGQVPWGNVQRFEYLGELALGGGLRSVGGALCAALALAAQGGSRQLVAPKANLAEFAMAPQGSVVPIPHLRDVVKLLHTSDTTPWPQPSPASREPATTMNLDQIVGQQAAKRALAVAASGRHHLLLVGPPGVGKTLLARSLNELLPELRPDAAREVAAVQSAAGLEVIPFLAPFRDPHHSATAPAMVGGGRSAQPGEISLAHHGVLFLDELPHFKPSVLNLLREPLESQTIELARSDYRATFPAAFQLMAAMNPCPAGLVCEESACRCSPNQVRRYQARISGPLLDRIDLHVPAMPIPGHLLLHESPEANGAELREQVARAQSHQLRRQGKLNAALSPGQVRKVAQPDSAAVTLLLDASEKFRLSARAVHRVLKVARSIADLDECDGVSAHHLAEAVSYRAMDWNPP